MCGYVKMYRSLADHWLADQPSKLGWWLLLILKASHKDIQVSTGSQIIDLKRGQLVASLSFLASLWKTSKTTADRFLDVLEKNSMVDRYTEHKLTIITICNYDRYQGEDNRKRNDISDDTSDDVGTMMGTKQECKECKEINNNISNTRTREERLSWVASEERGFLSRFQAQGSGIAVSRATGKNADEIRQLMNIFMAECELGDIGHRDFAHFNNHFLSSIKQNKIKIPAKEPQKKVISGQAIFDLL